MTDNVTVKVPSTSYKISNWNMSSITGVNNSVYGTPTYTVGAATIKTPTSTSSGSLIVNGGAVFEGDVKINGVSIVDSIEKINQRLSILVPDPAKLQQFEALKRAYEHYQMLEKICQLPTKND